MKTALLTGLAAFALGATCATALTGTGSAASTPTPVASTAGADDSCTGSSSTAPSCVVERILRLETPAPAASTGTQAAAADDDGTADQGRGDRPAPAATAPAAVPTAVAPPRAARPAAPAPVRTAERLRGDGSVDDSGPSAAAARADDDGTPDQGRGDRPTRVSSDDGDRSGRHGGDDRGHDRDDDHGHGDDDGTADKGSGDR